MKSFVLLLAFTGLVFTVSAQHKKTSHPSGSHSGKSKPVKKKKPVARTSQQMPEPQPAYDPQPVSPVLTVEERDSNEIYNHVDIMPEFPGGPAAMTRFLGSRLQYPEEARDEGIEGKVIVQFVIDQQGNVTNVTIMKDIGGGCGREAVRVVRSMPRWQPGKQNGKSVKVYYRLPVMFKLEDEAPEAPVEK